MRLCAIVTFESNDPALEPDRVNVSTVESTRAVRAAIVAGLPHLTRAICLLDEDEAKFMVAAHHEAMVMAGLQADIHHPPRAYRSPAFNKSAPRRRRS